MKKIYILLLLILSSSQAGATIDTGTYNVGDMTVIVSNINTNDLNIAVSILGVYQYTTLIQGGQNTLIALFPGKNEPRLLYVHNTSGGLIYRNYNLTNGLGANYDTLAISNNPGSIGTYVVCNTTTCYGMNNTSSAVGFTRTINNITNVQPINDNIIYGSSTYVSMICTTETIPNYTFVNIQPQEQSDILELIESPSTLDYAYSSLRSFYAPIQVTGIGMTSGAGWADFSTQSGSFDFYTKNSTILSERETWLSLDISNSTAGDQNKISSIKMLGDYGMVDIYRFDDYGNSSLYLENIDLSSYTESYGLNVGDYRSIAIHFRNSFFKKTIESLEIYAIGSDISIESDICLNKSTGEYTVNGDTYTGDPYVDLVGEPTPTDVTFTQNGYDFFENGFCLKDFLPYPSGGSLVFDIRDPTDTFTTTYSLGSSGLYRYGVGYCSKITTNYHTIQGQYYVKARYIYKGISYDVHSNFIVYNIISPQIVESNINPWEEGNKLCGANESSAFFLPGVSRFFACLSDSIENFSKKIYKNVSDVTQILKGLGDFFTVEEKVLSYVFPKTYAEGVNILSDFSIREDQTYKDSILGKIEKLLKGIVIVVAVVLTLLIISSSRIKNDQ